MNPGRRTALRGTLSAALLSALVACGGGGGGSLDDSGTPIPGTTCASPLPVQAVDHTVTVPVASDFDPTASPRPTPTTTIGFTALLPRRCPGDSFPLVLQSHGYGGERLRSAAANGNLDATLPHFDAVDALARALPHLGYVVISYDERGHGASLPSQAPHNARIIDPAAETQDAVALLDWAYDNPALSFVQQENGTGLAKDVRVGTLGYSYGGGFEMPLALLDARIDTLVPNGTWHNLVYSLVPGDAVKLGFNGLLCLFAVQGNVNNTPLVGNLCNQLGPANALAAVTLRTRADLVAAATAAGTSPRPVQDEDELLNFFYTHGTRWFDQPTRDGKTVGMRDTPAVTRPATRRPVSALFVQGQRDVLFNLTEAYLNTVSFKAAGGDVRLLGTEGGHMNPFAGQREGSANCGGTVGIQAMRAWFDEKLKGQSSSTASAIAPVCLSVTATPAANTAPGNAALRAVHLQDVPVGSLGGTGAIAARASTLTASVAVASGSTPSFAPVVTVTQSGAVLAGIPRVGRVSISAGAGALSTPVAYVGVGIRRGGRLILVDDQVTPFARTAPPAGTTDCPSGANTDHCHNRGQGNDTILLPGVGEMLESGDEVGLLFYENQAQYLPFTVTPLSSTLVAGAPNPYTATLTDVELPILLPCPNAAGCYPGSRLSQP